MRMGALSKYILCAAVAGVTGYFLGMQRPETAPPPGNLAKVVASDAASRMPGPGKSPPLPPAKGAATPWEVSAARIDSGEPMAVRLEQAFRMGEPFSIARAIALLGEMSAEDAPAVLDLLKAHPDWGNIGSPDKDPPVWGAFWMSWGASDPEAALASMDKGVPAFRFNDRTEKVIFAGLAMRDPERAAQLALTREGEVSRKWAVEGTIYRWAEKDLAAATNWALTKLEEPYQSWAIKTVPWAVEREQGAAAALRWWQGLPPDSEGEVTAFNTLVEISGRSSIATPQERMALFTAGQNRGLRSDPLEMRVASDYAKTDPEAGLKLFTALPAGQSGTYPAVGNIIREWAATDAIAAGTWVQEQTRAAWGADAIRGYAFAIKHTDPEAAARWQSLLTEKGAR